MTDLKIKTDHKWRNLLYGYELPQKVRKDFDYLTDEEYATRNFPKYRGYYYDVGEFERIPELAEAPMKQWHGYQSDSYFSGILIRFSEDGEQYQIATYFS